MTNGDTGPAGGAVSLTGAEWAIASARLISWDLIPCGLAATVSPTPLHGLAPPPDAGDIAPLVLTCVH
jgi:hypothetical protein